MTLTEELLRKVQKQILANPKEFDLSQWTTCFTGWILWCEDPNLYEYAISKHENSPDDFDSESFFTGLISSVLDINRETVRPLIMLDYVSENLQQLYTNSKEGSVERTYIGYFIIENFIIDNF